MKRKTSEKMIVPTSFGRECSGCPGLLAAAPLRLQLFFQQVSKMNEFTLGLVQTYGS
jgi:hypothetical protein